MSNTRFDSSPTSDAPRISPEYVVYSGQLGANVYSGPITVTHNLGVVPSVVVGHLEDVAQVGQFVWFVSGRSTSDVSVRFLNQGPAAPGEAILRFRLIY